MPFLIFKNALAGKTAAFFGVSLRVIIIIFLARLINDTGVRMVFPFIPQISGGLGLTTAAFGWLLFTRGLAGVSGPVFGLLADRYGRRKILAVSLLFQGAGAVGLVISNHWWAIVPIVVSGLSLAAFVPAQQAYISDMVPYHQRGRAMGVIELAWAVTGIALLPLVGWLIDRLDWRAPFMLFSVMALMGAALVWRQLPPVAQRQTHNHFAWDGIKKVLQHGNVLAAMAVAFLVFMAMALYMTVWGIWLSEVHRLSAVTLGLVATGIGLAELVGSLTSSMFIDRLGKKRGSIAGIVLAAAAFLVLPLTQNRLYAAIAALIVMGAILEYVIVSLLPLYSEQLPAARGTALSLVFLGISLGSAAGTPLTTTLWTNLGLWPIAVTGAIGLLAAAVLAGLALHDRPRATAPNTPPPQSGQLSPQSGVKPPV